MGHAIVTYAQQAYFVRKYPIFIILYHGPPMWVFILYVMPFVLLTLFNFLRDFQKGCNQFSLNGYFDLWILIFDFKGKRLKIFLEKWLNAFSQILNLDLHAWVF